MKRSSSSDLPQPESIRLARFDRPLRHGAGHSFGDAEVDRQVREAIVAGREQGRAAGYAAGWAQGRQAAAEEAVRGERAREQDHLARTEQEGTRLRALLTDLTRQAAELDRTLAPSWIEVADALTEGAIRIARAAIGRELANLQESRLADLRAAVRALGDPATVTVRVHPDDQSLLEDAAGPLPAGLTLLGDPAVSPGEVQALTPTQRLRMHLPTALAAAEEVLRG